MTDPGDTPEFPAQRGNRYRDTWAGQVTADAVGSEARLAGWVNRRRDHGGLVFIDLRDRTGLVQLVFDPDDAGSAFELGHKLRPEDVISVRGPVVERSPETVNPELPTGAYEVRVAEAELLSDSATPPFQIEGRGGSEAGEETRLRYRYLDLRREPMQEALQLRAKLVAAMREQLDGDGFVEIETPILTRSTPEGARDFLVPSRLQQGSFYALPQSPQLFKQLLMVAGFERYYQIARCFRDEDLRADRQPDFTQIDVEASFVGVEDVLGFGEGLVAALWSEAGQVIDTPIPRMRHRDAMERYGTDKPDLRFGLELTDVTDVFRSGEFSVTRNAIAAGGRVRGIRVPGGGTLTRKQVDEIESAAKSLGAAGLLRLKVAGGQLEGPAAKFLAAGAAERLGLADGDLGLYVAGPDHVSGPSLDRTRQEVARRRSLIPSGVNRFVWIVDFPLFEKDPVSGALGAVNHPFTAPHPDDVPLLDTAPEQARALAYDMVLNGTELGGGSLRIADPRLQRRVFGLLGIPEAQAEQRFGFLLEGLRAGAPPHGGFAFGMDRIVMLLAGVDSLRDVIAFPKTTAQRALFEGAPTAVDAEDLRELNLEVKG